MMHTCIKYITTVRDAMFFSILDLDPALVICPARIMLSLSWLGLCRRSAAVPRDVLVSLFADSSRLSAVSATDVNLAEGDAGGPAFNPAHDHPDTIQGHCVGPAMAHAWSLACNIILRIQAMTSTHTYKRCLPSRIWGQICATLLSDLGFRCSMYCPARIHRQLSATMDPHPASILQSPPSHRDGGECPKLRPVQTPWTSAG